MDSRYDVQPLTSALLEGKNVAQQFTAHFVDDGVQLRLNGGADMVVRAALLRCADRSEPIEGSLRSLERGAQQRVSRSLRAGHAVFDEWYVNGPAGLEQGWTFEG